MFENKNYISRHLIINQETTTQDLKDFEFTFIELKKFDTQLEELNSTIDKWIYFINNASSFELIPKEYEDIKEFQEAFQIANRFSWTKKELDYYDRVLMRQMDDTLVKQRIEEDLETAKQKGREEEKIKSDEKLKIMVESLLKSKVDKETIKLSTGLSDTELANITHQWNLQVSH